MIAASMIDTGEGFEKRRPTELGMRSLVALGWKRKKETGGPGR